MERPPFSWDDLLRRVRHTANALVRLQEADVQAYFNLTQARGGGDPEKLAEALEEAISCPLRIMQRAQEGLALIAQGGSRCKLYLLSDLLVACELLGAAFRGAYHIARANLLLMSRNPRRAVWAEDLAHTLKAAEALCQQVSADLWERQSCP
jgi:formiminotetrahydrofolate cyclodeaminase